MWPVVAMMAMSALKARQDQANADAQLHNAKTTARYSPWTGMKPGEVRPADGLGTMMQGATTGLMMDQAMKNQEAQKNLTDAQTNYYNNAAASQSAGTAAGAGNSSYGQQMSMAQQDPLASKYPWLAMNRS
jgi:hypothetical protein